MISNYKIKLPYIILIEYNTMKINHIYMTICFSLSEFAKYVKNKKKN